VAHDQVLAGLGGRTAHQAIAAGTDVKDVWLAVCEQFQVPALAVDRYQSSINGHVTAVGHGTDLATLELTARGTLNDASVPGAGNWLPLGCK